MLSLLLFMLSLHGSGDCSGNVDPYTKLTECEMKDITRQVRESKIQNPVPVKIMLLDSTIAYQDSMLARLKQERHSLMLHYQYNIVCNVCFANKLSCGNRKPNTFNFVCLNEGRGY